MYSELSHTRESEKLPHPNQFIPQQAAYRETALYDVTGYINAGGRGTRLNGIFPPRPLLGISKAILEVGDPPIPLINHHINKMRRAGVPKIVAGVGDHAHVAAHVEKQYPSRSQVRAIKSAIQLGNGGDLVKAVRKHPELFDDEVLVTNVDTLLDLDERAILEQHREYGAVLTIALTLNKGVPNENAYYVSADSRVVYCGESTANTRTDHEATPPHSLPW